MTIKVGCWIDNNEIKPANGSYFDDLNPINDNVYASVYRATKKQVDNAVSTAQSSFKKYLDSPVNEREAWLNRAAELLEQQADEFIEILIDEIGSPYLKAKFEVRQSILILRAAAGSCRHVSGKTMPSDTQGRWSMSIRQPIGVVASITPFNVPLSKGVRLTSSPLALGNSVVMLPSEQAPVMALKLAKLYQQAGVPSGLFNVITGFGHEVGDYLTSHQDVKVVTFTGSCQVGKHIQKICAKYNKKVTLELGGKNPLVVLDDADIEVAVRGTIQSTFIYQGQICMTASRIYVHNDILEKFTDAFCKAAKSLARGDLRNESTQIGPIINQRQRERVKYHIQDALDKGATVLSGNEWHNNVCMPTVLTGVTEEMAVYKEETFGPVTAIYPIDSLDEAITKANDSKFGLSASIFTTNINSALRFSKQVQSGMVHVNSATIYAEPHVPFGGIGESGFGREGTEVDIDIMTEWKWITIQE